MSIQLRGGHTTEDPRLDRLPQFDERSRQYAVRDLLPAGAEVRAKTWQCGWLLDQRPEPGYDGSGCTNFSTAHNRLSTPYPKRVGNGTVAGVEAFARERYGRSKEIDEWPGEDYEGTSLLAALKAWQERGLMGAYHWAFGIDDAMLAVSHVAPVLFASDWTEGQMEPAQGGLIKVEGNVVGGHAYAGNGLVLHPQRSSRWKATGAREPLLVGPQSWGRHHSPEEWPQDGSRNWGNDGWWAMTVSDVEKLLKAQGECAVPTDHHR